MMDLESHITLHTPHDCLILLTALVSSFNTTQRRCTVLLLYLNILYLFVHWEFSLILEPYKESRESLLMVIQSKKAGKRIIDD